VFTPYDWQEGIGNRAQYIEGRLAQGAPVFAVSLNQGILLFTYRRQARKIYEIYDRLVMAGIGRQTDVEAMRLSALEFASREGYSRSEEDVTIQRVANAMSAPLKRAFSDFSTAPLVARTLFAEVGPSPIEDLYQVLDYDGDFSLSRSFAVLAGTIENAGEANEKLKTVNRETSTLEEARANLREVWMSVVNPDRNQTESEVLDGLFEEAVLLERSNSRENRFRLLTVEEF
jgi:proteasome alpha subunit